MQLNGQFALVTGGGSGLGAATACALSRTGAKVGVVDRDADAAGTVGDEIGALGIAADVTNVDDVQAAFARLHGEFGMPARIVGSCAGIGTAARILPRDGTPSIEAFERTLRVNLIGTYAVLSIAARVMSALAALEPDGERGVIINTVSVAFEDGQIGQAAYAASKGGLADAAGGVRIGALGIRVAAVAPGLFETAMTKGLPAESRGAIIANIPFPHRLGHADEFAALAFRPAP